ncbi:DUF4389 domain-containing protein [Dietzia sp. ANT_WB102]|uniref:DUF4389 domain-containing protein n=1 Tax=Dietzia sp. ANT_WB102 TaxID=2597345 RepID=UPI0011EDFC67|nr:DUF4389 domain-containing protein [Dietzia sp. ANT_WB102]KAA0918918.1 DUF4389 domain-containing protein [Dietzia sp. ANT_WB102]
MDANAVYPTTPSEHSDQRARTRPVNWVLLVVGVILTTLGLALTAGGAVLMAAQAAQSDGHYLTTAPQRFQSTGHAITTTSILIDAEQAGMPGLGDPASVQIRATSVVPGQPVFVGIADDSDVSAYLDGVPHAVVRELPWTGNDTFRWAGAPNTDGNLREVPGTRTPAAPADQNFWATSATGEGEQTVTFDLQDGQWSLVVMNADASEPVWVDVDAGVRTELLGVANPGLLIAGIVGLILGVPLLLLGAAGLGRDIDRGPTPRDGETPPAGSASDASAQRRADCCTDPLSITGHLDPGLSRWQWLFKWLLAIPHYIVIGLLWFALTVTTIASGLTILVTGRYPRSLFAFSVGVLRWNWRVGFYAYAALGTDRYPPFSLAAGGYPADLEVDYPERLSRLLVLFKWWLLALPHLFIVGILTGSVGVFGNGTMANNTNWGIPLVSLLVLIAAVTLLFTARYPRGLFDLVLGLNRWVYRVATYVLLLRDQYPPFRLDQGAEEPVVGAPENGDHMRPDDQGPVAPGPE